MSENQSFQQLFESARGELAYKVERLVSEITEQITERMEAKGFSKSDLAERIKVSPPYITKLLKGETNFTAESMVKISQAFDCDVEVKFVPKKSRRDWIDLFGKTVERSPELRAWSQVAMPYRGAVQFHCSTSSQSFLHEIH